MNDLEVRNKTCSLRMIPVYSEIAEGNISVSHIKEVEIEDLLGRQPVKLDRTDVAEFVRGKNIMVTGAGGSIGSELCNQIAAYQPELLLLFEFCEYNLYEITRVLKKKYPDLKIISFVGDVRSSENIERALSHNIEVVYHAAAFKHVPLMEQNPTMALDTNVLGSSRIATCCEQAGVKRVILVSTDKAVCPTSIMGASKRIAERVILERPQSSTEFVVVRFGNVLGSSGSVIPLFKQQIKDGGPVTLTSENMVRYFMSIPEAVDLLLQAGAIGNDRDIMVLEMGEQVRIYDMAKKLIELSGLIPGRDIEIKITGIRPGEKEYEELLTDKEKVDRTPYDRIFVARKDNSASPPGIDLEKISQVVKTCETVELRELIFQYIPEHKFNPESR
jgi:FlaA1/EpsC-like NDP-sugar epimerase